MKTTNTSVPTTNNPDWLDASDALTHLRDGVSALRLAAAGLMPVVEGERTAANALVWLTDKVSADLDRLAETIGCALKEPARG